MHNSIVLDMSFEASPAQRELIERHHCAIELLKRKLAIVPKRIFSIGDYPSIQQFYEQADSLHIPTFRPNTSSCFFWSTTIPLSPRAALRAKKK